MRKKKKPQRGDGTVAYPLSFRHSFGVLMGGCFHAGVTLSLHHLPKVCRPFGAYNPHNLIPNSRSDGGGTFISGGRPAGFTTCLYSVALTALYFVSSVYPRRCLGLTSYALCFASSSCQRTSFPLRTANFVFSALFRLELTYNLLDAYHSPFCFMLRLKKKSIGQQTEGREQSVKQNVTGCFA